MSFSFGFTAASKALAKTEVVRKMAQTVREQPVHAVDAVAVIETAHRYIDGLVDPAEGQVIGGTISGSVGGDIDWTTGTVNAVAGANIGVSVYLTTAPKEVKA